MQKRKTTMHCVDRSVRLCTKLTAGGQGEEPNPAGAAKPAIHICFSGGEETFYEYFIFWNPVAIKVLKYARAMAGKALSTKM